MLITKLNTTNFNKEVIKKYNFKSDMINKGRLLWGEGVTSIKPHRKVTLKYNTLTNELDMFYQDSSISTLNSGYVRNDNVIVNYENKFLILPS